MTGDGAGEGRSNRERQWAEYLMHVESLHGLIPRYSSHVHRFPPS